MKKLLFFVFCFQAFFGYAQLSSIRYEKVYNSIAIQPVKENKPSVVKDTIRIRDTIFIHDTKINEDAPFKPIVADVSSPLPNLKITSNYGMRLHPVKRKWLFHSGVDFRAFKDTVKVVIGGIVHSSGYDNGLGNFVKIQTGNFVLTYAHLSQYFLLKDMHVSAGEPIGITGSTGISTGEHLHFAVHHNGISIDPIDFLKSLIEIKSTLALNKTYEKRTEH